MVWSGFNRNGTLATAWRDRRGLGTGARTQFNLYGTTSTDGGASFKKNSLLSTNPSNFSSLTRGNDFIGLAVDTNTVHVAWGDYIGNWEVFYDRHPLQDLSVVSSRATLDRWLMLNAIYPNPATGTVVVRFTLGHSDLLSIRILNLDGATIRAIAPLYFEAGVHEVTLDLKGIASAAYSCELRASDAKQIVRLIVQQ